MNTLELSTNNNAETKYPDSAPHSFEEVLEILIQRSPIIGSGKDGVILKIDVANIEPAIISLLQKEGMDLSINNLAAKILKIYRPGEGKKEFDFHQRAFELLSQAENVARVPKPILLKVQRLTESDKNFLNTAGARLEDYAEILLMDYVDGQDFTTLMYTFILEKMGFDTGTIRSLTLEEQNKIIGDRLNFSPIDEEDAYVANVVSIENSNKMIDFLQKHQFKTDAKVIEQLENGIRLLEKNGIFHNDFSERNAMLTDDGTAFIIDFGRTTDNKEDHFYDDHAMIRRLKKINAGKTIDQAILHKEKADIAIWETGANKIMSNAKWAKIIPNWEKSINSGDMQTIKNTVGSMLGDESYLNQALSAITHVLLTSIDKNMVRQKIIEMITDVITVSQQSPFSKSKLNRFIKFISNL